MGLVNRANHIRNIGVSLSGKPRRFQYFSGYRDLTIGDKSGQIKDKSCLNKAFLAKY